MINISLIPVLLFCMVFTSCKKDQSTKTPFDFNHKFALSKHLNAEMSGLDASEWRLLDIPHDFSLKHPFDSTHQAGSGGGYIYGDIGWYRKSFTTESEFADKKVGILFGGAYLNSEVRINGHYFGGSPYSSSFYYDITPYLNPADKENVLEVKMITAERPNSGWYTRSGVYNPVWLIIKNKFHIQQCGVFAHTVKANKKQANVDIAIELNNENGSEKRGTLVTQLINAEGKVVGKAESDVEAKANQTLNVRQNISISKPLFWSGENPNLYLLRIEVKVGATLIDRYEQPFGIRTLNFDPNNEFSLSGKQAKFKGVSNHRRGGPELAAPGNGNQRSHIPLKDRETEARLDKCLAVILSTQEKRKITITASSASLSIATATSENKKMHLTR